MPVRCEKFGVFQFPLIHSLFNTHTCARAHTHRKHKFERKNWVDGGVTEHQHTPTRTLSNTMIQQDCGSSLGGAHVHFQTSHHCFSTALLSASEKCDSGPIIFCWHSPFTHIRSGCLPLLSQSLLRTDPGPDAPALSNPAFRAARLHFSGQIRTKKEDGTCLICGGGSPDCPHVAVC